jgi:mannose-6-phosphate isomerase-like protein (cupin superfamily)
MKVTVVSELPIKDTPHKLEARQVVNVPGVVAMQLTIQPGQSVPRHSAPVNVFFYVLSGSGVIECGDERAAVSADTVVESAAGTQHAVHNTGADPLRLLVVKTPQP